MGRKCYLHGLLDDRTAILDAWHVLSCPVRHARAFPARPELFASSFVCISFWVEEQLAEFEQEMARMKSDAIARAAEADSSDDE